MPPCPGRRKATIDLAAEIERRGFTGLYCPSFGDGLALCEALALATTTIPFGTSIVNIYTRHASDFAQTAAFIHEISGGRFRFGIGVSHALANARLGVQSGKPLADMRRFVEALRKAGERTGPLPPIVLAALRRKMVALAGEIADGAVWANAARSHMHASLQALPPKAHRDDFFLGNMIPTCVCDDRAAGAAVMRRVLLGYVQLPNYQRYWIEAGYEEEMTAIQRAIARTAAGQADRPDERSLAERRDAVRTAGTRSRRRRRMDRRRRAHAHPRAVVDTRRPDGGAARDFRRVCEMKSADQ